MAKKRGVCIRQGSKVEHKLCSSKGCVNKIQMGESVESMHGAKAKQCSSKGCMNKAQKRGGCSRHRAAKDAQILASIQECA
eukprot:scaffold1712_cov86-Skeletonema_marinoi.AAC.2